MAITLVLLPVGVVTFALAAEVSELATKAPGGVDRLLASPALQQRALELYDQLRERLPFLGRIDREQLGASFQSAGDVLIERSVKFAGSALQAIVEFVIIAFTLFFFLRDGERFADELRDLLPLRRKQADELLGSVVELLRASTLGVVVVAAVQGFLGGVMFALLGLSSPLLWGVAMALLSVIPVLGTGVVWLPASAYLFFSGDTVKAVVLLAWGVLVVETIDNLLRPVLVGSRTRLHELVVFFGVLGGLRLFGMVGVFVGPALFSIAASLIALARERSGAGLPEARRREAAA
jgi:predicted PurR-regulated permease PerM